MKNESRISVRTLTAMALLIAMSIVFSRVLSISTGFVRFNLGSLPVLLAGILKKVCANYNGVLARYGGDEFCIACGCNSVEVRTLIASIQRELDAANAASGKPYQIEISIGCARLEPDIATVHDLVDKADREMYHLKTRKHGTS